jgi:hypothetical protein
MTMRNMIWASICAVALSGAVSSASASPSPTAKRCLLNDYSMLQIAPYKMDENFGLGGYTVLKGAQMYVAAKPGLTAEWLTLQVQRELAALDSGSDPLCAPTVKNVKVSVTPAGGGFWVFLAAPDVKQAQSLFRWTKANVAQPEVRVQ